MGILKIDLWPTDAKMCTAYCNSRHSILHFCTILLLSLSCKADASPNHDDDDDDAILSISFVTNTNFSPPIIQIPADEKNYYL